MAFASVYAEGRWKNGADSAACLSGWSDVSKGQATEAVRALVEVVEKYDIRSYTDLPVGDGCFSSNALAKLRQKKVCATHTTAATPRHAAPRHAPSCSAPPRPAPPRPAPQRPTPLRNAPPRHATPRPSSPRPATPRLATPRHDNNSLARTRQAISYIGLDIVKKVIEHNLVKRDNMTRLVQVDVVSLTRLPGPTDLIFSRQMMQHMCNRDVQHVLDLISRSGARFALLTHFETAEAMDNSDIHCSSGGYRPQDLLKPPFSLPPPISYWCAASRAHAL